MSLILIVFYIGVVFATKTLVFNLPNGPFSKISCKCMMPLTLSGLKLIVLCISTVVIISILMWVIIFGVTYLQLSHAYALFLVTFQVILIELLLYFFVIKFYNIFSLFSIAGRVGTKSCSGT